MNEQSSNAELLLAASRDVDLEASNNSFEQLLHAADEVAAEAGMPSPLKSAVKSHAHTTSKISTPASILKSPTGHMNNDSMNHTAPLAPKQDLNHTMDTTQIRSAIKSSSKSATTTAGSIDTRDAANDLMSQIVNSSSHSNTFSRRSRPPRPDSSGGFLGHTRKAAPPTRVDPQHSEVAKFLIASSDKSYGDKLVSSFESYTQEMLFRTMMQPNVAEGKSKSKPKSKKTDDDSKDSKSNSNTNKKSYRKNNFSKEFASMDDAKECTFQPAIHGNKNNESGNNNNGEEAKGGVSFFDRQEAKDSERRRKTELARGKKDYDAVIDKKYCPNCGATQSYDEVKEKRKTCANCNVEYKSKITWGAVKGNFMKKQLTQAEHREIERQKIMEDLLRDELRKRYSKFDRNRGEVIVDVKAIKKELEGHKKWDDETQEEFFKRMRDGQQKKELSLKELDKRIITEKYPFKPSIKKKSNGQDGDDDDEGGAEEFLRRLEEDLEKRKLEKMKLNGGKTQREVVAEKLKEIKTWKPS